MKTKERSESIDDDALQKIKRREQITKTIALVVAFVSVFFFFIKLLFL